MNDAWIYDALHLWIMDEQLTSRRQFHFEKTKQSLKLFCDESGVLRMKGGFENSALSYQQQHPIILRSGESYVTQLIKIPRMSYGTARHQAQTSQTIELTFCIIRFIIQV